MSGPLAPDEERAASFVAAVLTCGASVAVAYVAFGQATTDWRYQLAGLADPFLGRPAPGWTIGVYLLVSLVFAASFAVGRRLLTDPGDPRPRHDRRPWVPRWWWLIVALWAGYLAGAAATVLSGGGERYTGTMRLDLGEPLGLAVETQITCTTAPGASGRVVSLFPDRGGVPYIRLANEATGERNIYPTVGGAVILEIAGPGTGSLAIPGLPTRPDILTLGLGQQMGPAGPGGRFVVETPIRFLESYYYAPVSSAFDASSGTATFTATRRGGLMNVDELVPDDPWPETFRLTTTWRCGLSAASAAPVPVPGGGSQPGLLAWPSPPSPSAVGVDAELRLASSADGASVVLSGANIDAVELLSVAGPGTTRFAGTSFHVDRPVSSASATAVTAATFRFRIRDATAGTRLGMDVAAKAGGKTQVTLYNVLGPEPVPVFTNLGVSADRPGWPIEVEAGWLIEPVAVERQTRP